jgi:hypothetical protein
MDGRCYFGKQCWDLREVDRLKAVSVRNGYNMHGRQDATNSAAQFIIACRGQEEQDRGGIENYRRRR